MTTLETSADRAALGALFILRASAEPRCEVASYVCDGRRSSVESAAAWLTELEKPVVLQAEMRDGVCIITHWAPTPDRFEPGLKHLATIELGPNGPVSVLLASEDESLALAASDAISLGTDYRFANRWAASYNREDTQEQLKVRVGGPLQGFPSAEAAGLSHDEAMRMVESLGLDEEE